MMSTMSTPADAPAGTPGSSPDQPIDSPSGWVKEHIDRYVATDGKDGHEWNGTTALLLTYQGAESGLWRRTALIYGESGGAYALVASKGGAPADPAWYTQPRRPPRLPHPGHGRSARRDGAHAPRTTSGPPSGRS